MSALHFPSRFALLVRSWGIQHTSTDLTSALGAKKDRLSKFASGDAVKLDEQRGRLMAEALARYLHRTGALESRGLTEKEFLDEFWYSDDLRFARFVTSRHQWPIPSSVQSAPRQNVLALADRITGKCLLYRLGIERRRIKSDPDTTVENKIPVLRRIPVMIEDHGDAYNYLNYKDSYGWYGATYEAASATGFVFYTKSYICVFAEDIDARKQSDLFMIELRERLMDASDLENPLREGVILMKGDLDTPAAAKVILRRAPDAFQTIAWEKFAKQSELKIELQEDREHKTYKVREGVDTTEVIGNVRVGSKSLNWYSDFLQIRDQKIDISLNDE